LGDAVCWCGTVDVVNARTPAIVPVDGLDELFDARDALIVAWRAGVIDPATVEARLRALACRDAAGAWWRLRPGPRGAVLVRVTPDGGVAVADPSTFRRRTAPMPVWQKAAIAAAAVMWAVVLIRYLNGVG
jgi:hypothetical protein